VRLDCLRIHPNALCEVGRFEDIRILRENAVWSEAYASQYLEVQRFQFFLPRNMHEFHLLIYLRQFAHWFQKRGSMRLLITWQKERSNPQSVRDSRFGKDVEPIQAWDNHRENE